MKWFALVSNFYLNASVHVALALFALLQATDLIFGIRCERHLALFLFFGTISGYNFLKYGLEAKKYVAMNGPYLKTIPLFSILAFAMALYQVQYINLQAWPAIGAMLFLTGVYALPVLPNAQQLRSWGGLKIFVVALVWALGTVLLPVLDLGKPISWDVGVEAVQRFLLVLALMVPFEIRDLACDPPKLKTLPQRIGVAKTKIFGSVAVILFFMATYLKDGVLAAEVVSKMVITLTVLATLAVTPEHQDRYFSSFWVESIPIIWWGMLVVISA